MRAWVVNFPPDDPVRRAVCELGTMKLGAIAAHHLGDSIARGSPTLSFYRGALRNWLCRELNTSASRRPVLAVIAKAVSELAIAATGACTRRFDLRQGKVVLEPDRSVLEWSRASLLAAEPPRFAYLPMLTAPRPWIGNWSGGYLSGRMQQQLIDIRTAEAKNPFDNDVPRRVLQAVNALQMRARAKIDQGLLEIAIRGVEGRRRWPGLVVWDETIPEVPKNLPDIKLTRRQRARRKAAIGRISRSLLHLKVIQHAKRVAGARRLYFPLHLDARGRMYPRPHPLSYQGCELAQALLEPEFGGPLETEAGNFEHCREGYRLFHGKRSKGPAALEFEREHRREIEILAGDPTDALSFWRAADKPWLFLSWCRARHGKTAPTVQLDAVASVFQMMALVMRAKGLAAKTGLTAEPVMLDLYEQIGLVAGKILAGERNRFADEVWNWCGGRIPRGLAKESAVARPMGITTESMRNLVRLWLDEHHFDLPLEYRDNAIHLVAVVLARATTLEIPELAPFLGWMRAIAGAALDNNLELRWTMPDGFVVALEPKEKTHAHVETKRGPLVVRKPAAPSRRSRFSYRVGMGSHLCASIDSFLARKVTRRCKEFGVRFFTARHDGFRVHAEDAQHLRRAVCDSYAAFASMPFLETFQEEIDRSLGKYKTGRLSPGSLTHEDVFAAKDIVA